MKTVIAVQARLSSTRMPRKVLADLNGWPMLSQIVRRCRASGLETRITCPPEDTHEIWKATGEKPIPGPEEDVLGRVLTVGQFLNADYVFRVTADCPFVPWDALKWVANNHVKNGPRLIQNWKPRVHPDGFDFECWDVKYLEDLDTRLEGKDREWFAQWVLEKEDRGIHIPSSKHLAEWRLTVDYVEDLAVAREIYASMGDDIWDTKTLVEWLSRHPTVLKGNACRIKDFGARPK